MRLIACLTFVFISVSLIILTTDVSATVYISDHFDSQSDWNGCSDAPSPWSHYFWSSGKYCNQVYIGGGWNDAHGSSGKSVKIVWSSGISERGMETDKAGGKGSIWTGYWWRHDPGYTMPEQDKWIYFPTAGGDRSMLSHISGTICFFANGNYNLCATNHPSTGSSSWYNDVTWHSFVIYASPASNDLRVWRDGVEMTWSGNNLNAGWGGSSFDSSSGDGRMLWGYQSRNGWSGHVSYFDDIIVASTQQEVLDFLGESGPPGDTVDPTITIASPTSQSTHSTGSSPINLGGTALDNVGVTQVTWSNDRGDSGTASGTTSWNANGITLYSETNTITVSARDVAGNTGTDVLTVTYTAPDSDPPVRSQGSPSGTLSAGTSSTAISLTTDEAATCRYSTSSGVYYSSMPNTFSSTGGTGHSTTVSGLANDQSYTYYVRCIDGSSNANTNDYTISFSVSSSSGDTGLPFSDDFESGSFNSWHGSSGPIVVYSSGCYEGTYCSRATITSGSVSEAYVDYYFGEKDGKDPVEEVTLNSYVKFDGYTSWPEFAHKVVNLNIQDSAGDRSYQIILAIAGTNSGRAGEYYVENTYWKTWDFYARYQNQGSPASVVNNQWAKLTVYGKLNTPGQSNGIIRLYVNDVLKMEYTNLNIREGTSDTFGKMVMTSGANSQATDSGYELWDTVSLQQGNHPPSGGGDTPAVACSSDPECDDSDSCTDDVCINPGQPSSYCQNDTNTAPCDDGDSCTDNDICSFGTCSGTPKTCQNNDGCCPAGCDQANDNDCGDIDCSGLEMLLHLNQDNSVQEDSSGSGNDAIVSGSVYTPSGRFGGAYSFNGGYITSGASGMSVSEGTVLVWAYPLGPGEETTSEYIFSHRDSGQDNRIYLLRRASDNNQFYGGFGTSAAIDTNVVMNDNDWHMLAITWSGPDYDLYLDDVAVLSGSSSQLSSISSNLFIGNYIDGNQGFNGIIDEVSAWSRALTSQEIQDIFNSGQPISCGSQTYHRADNNPQNGCVDMGELISFIDEWKMDSTGYPMWEMMGALEIWRGC